MRKFKSLNDLTKQESAVLALVAKGRRNAQIANELSISTRTVESHLYRIFDKLGVSSRTEAMLSMMRGINEDLSGISEDMETRNHYS